MSVVRNNFWYPTILCDLAGYADSLPLYSISGVPNLLLLLPQMTTVKTWFGYGLSRLRKVGSPFVEAAYRVLTTVPQIVAVSLT